MLKDATYVRSFASLVTLYPDAVFHMYQLSPQTSYILVAIDYPDPLDDSRQLKEITGRFKIEFTHLIKPYANREHIEIKEHDEMDGGFVLYDPDSKWRYYLAAAEQKGKW